MSNNSSVIAKDNTIRVSTYKLKNIANLIVNLNVNKAVNQLKFSNKRVSLPVLKVLNSAIANAENNNQMDIDNLFVKEAFVGKSLTMKRFRPRAKGRATSILKPFSKLTIILEERISKKENKQKITNKKTKKGNK
ncbi:MAG: 50S ribosomal protein L22 [Alphaproteobacteria bacterium MarineAlpha5_Bin8]|nr:MAG: 50S ribosomal protein L22 [Alphaproteobacteria bacterium MarineAlpha5_Bin7]PPR48081.1 MAG: 50S ribosomal protein L22 [Alphaproteobacteria bacterium MarineAlpha5_Bin8]PPR54040.1 MAG: 50S ribosomal protein L22 [Alphaproteobacteria bacterium MarineAlpha5_Bin6]|tara:strand:- start:2246 stop:2650 length:405 start_codon:yes stop_codon:yes gene_type:complete